MNTPHETPTLATVRQTLKDLQTEAPSPEVFTRAVKLNYQLVDVYLATKDPDEQAAILALDQEVVRFHSALEAVLEQQVQRRADEVMALSQRTGKTPQRGPSYRQLRDKRPGDVMQSAA
ncbi:MAG: hypothetical protein AAB383_01740 [Patescibacteria group bacterium]